MLILRFALWIFPLALIVTGPGVVSGQDDPNKPVRIVATTVGGGGDLTGRIVAEGISGPLMR